MYIFTNTELKTYLAYQSHKTEGNYSYLTICRMPPVIKYAVCMAYAEKQASSH